MLIINSYAFYLKYNLRIRERIFRILIILYINIMHKQYKLLVLCVLYVLFVVNIRHVCGAEFRGGCR